MELIIDNPENLNLEDFIYNFLFDRIKEYLISILNEKALIPIEEYINSPDVLNRLKIDPSEDIYISLKPAIIAAISYLVVNRSDNNYVITIDSEKRIPKITAKLVDIASLVNYGSMGSPAYPIFTDTFDFIASQLQELFEEYNND